MNIYYFFVLFSQAGGKSKNFDISEIDLFYDSGTIRSKSQFEVFFILEAYLSVKITKYSGVNKLALVLPQFAGPTLYKGLP